MAQLLVQKAQWLLLDEPSSALDLQHQLQLQELISGLKSEGKSILLVHHDLNWARQLADECWLLDGGQLRFVGPMEDLWTTPQFLKAFQVKMEEFHGRDGQKLLWPQRIDSSESLC